MQEQSSHIESTAGAENEQATVEMTGPEPREKEL